MLKVFDADANVPTMHTSKMTGSRILLSTSMTFANSLASERAEDEHEYISEYKKIYVVFTISGCCEKIIARARCP